MNRVEQLKGLVARYGRLAIYLHFGVYLLCLCGATAAIHLGAGTLFPGLDELDLAGAAWLAERWGAFGLSLAGGYACTQLLKLPRIALTLAFTPVLARWLGRVEDVAT